MLGFLISLYGFSSTCLLMVLREKVKAKAFPKRLATLPGLTKRMPLRGVFRLASGKSKREQ